MVVRWLYLIISVAYCQGRYFRENKTQERPCILTLLDPTKKYCILYVLSQTRNVSVFGTKFISELAYLRPDLSHHVIDLAVGLFSKCEVDCMLLERTAGALKRVFYFHEGISRWLTLVDAVNRIWWENSYIGLLLYINVPLAMGNICLPISGNFTP